MFTGEFKHTIDAKGRVSVPSDMRDALRSLDDDKFVVTQGVGDACLWVLPMSAWKELTDIIKKKGLGGRALTRLRRKLFTNAKNSGLDKVGRISLTEQAIEYAGLGKDVVFAGVGTHIELWAPDQWDEQKAILDEDDNEDLMLDTLAELGL